MAKGFLLPALALVVSASRGVLSAPAAGMTTNVTASDLGSPTPSEAENKQVARAEHFPSIADREERMPLNAQEAAEEMLTLAEHLPEFTLNNGQRAGKEPRLSNSIVNWLASNKESSNRAHGARAVNRARESESATKTAKLFSFSAQHHYEPEELEKIARRMVRDDDLSGRIRAKRLADEYKAVNDRYNQAKREEDKDIEWPLHD